MAVAKQVMRKDTQGNLLRKFTTTDDDGSNRRFIFDKSTHLQPVDSTTVAEISHMWTPEGYGATMQVRRRRRSVALSAAVVMLRLP